MSNHICVRCDGEGVETFYDGGFYNSRLEQHTCYHCNGSGYVDDETTFHDQLYSVAYSLSAHYVYSMIQEMNNDPEGDGFCLMAAENGLSERDYIDHLINMKVDQLGADLVNKSLQDQQLLIAWNNLPVQPIHKNKKQEVLVTEIHLSDDQMESDHISF
jgi:hypothetical protein